ncbi:MAG: hypothetical protein PT939_05000 [Aerococcus suis]|nr:hypothetical protein [Aerococcus suis]
MRFFPEEIAQIIEPIVRYYGLMEDQVINLIVDGLLSGRKKQPPDDWRRDKLNKYNAVYERAIYLLESYEHKMSIKLANLSEQVKDDTKRQIKHDLTAMKSLDVPKDGLSFKHTEELNAKIQTARNQVKATLIGQAGEEYLKQVNRIYDELVNSDLTVEEAVRKSMKPVVQDGLPGFIDKSGKEWKPDVYMRSVFRNSMKQYHNDERLQGFYDNGVRLVVVSEHPASRPSHYGYQNKVYSLYGDDSKYPNISVTGVGDPAGLLGVNCRHFLMPYDEKMTLKDNTYSAEENAEMYDLLSEQRYKERYIREKKRLAELYSKTNDSDKARIEKQKQRKASKELNALIDKGNKVHGNYLRRQYARERK